MNINDFFYCLSDLAFKSLFDDFSMPWLILDENNLKGYIDSFFASLSGADNYKKYKSHLDITHINSGIINEGILTVVTPFALEDDLVIRELSIFIGKGTVLEPAVIKMNTIIGRDCHIRQGAYLRGNVLTGDRCVLGHVTEIKNSILMNHVEAGHFAYIGDSILGTHVNLGAGTKLANLQLRTQEEKNTGKIKSIKVTLDGIEYDTGKSKLGAIIGDYVEIGCNAVTAPATFIGRFTWVYPNTTVKKGCYPTSSIIKEFDNTFLKIGKDKDRV